MLWMIDAPVVSKAAYGFATAEVRVQPPSGALGRTTPCCNGSLPSWYGGSVGSTPTGGSSKFRVSGSAFRVEARTHLNSKHETRNGKRMTARYANGIAAKLKPWWMWVR